MMECRLPKVPDAQLLSGPKLYEAGRGKEIAEPLVNRDGDRCRDKPTDKRGKPECDHIGVYGRRTRRRVWV